MQEQWNLRWHLCTQEYIKYSICFSEVSKNVVFEAKLPHCYIWNTQTVFLVLSRQIMDYCKKWMRNFTWRTFLIHFKLCLQHLFHLKKNMHVYLCFSEARQWSCNSVSLSTSLRKSVPSFSRAVCRGLMETPQKTCTSHSIKQDISRSTPSESDTKYGNQVLIEHTLNSKTALWQPGMISAKCAMDRSISSVKLSSSLQITSKNRAHYL